MGFGAGFRHMGNRDKTKEACQRRKNAETDAGSGFGVRGCGCSGVPARRLRDLGGGRV